MDRHSSREILLLPLLVLVGLTLIGCGGSQAVAEQSGAASPASSRAVAPSTVAPDSPFPAMTFQVANAGGSIPGSVNLADDIGTRAVVLYYWIAGHPRADAVLTEVIDVLAESGDGAVLYAVAVPRPDSDAAAIGKRAREMQLQIPVLLDEEFILGGKLQVRSVPNLSIVDRTGILRLTNGASLRQNLEYKLDLAEALRRVARGDELMTYGYLGRYYPVTELEGEPCPDFSAPLVTTKVEQRWKSLMESDKLNVLIFWSVDCGHCRRSLPAFNTWLQGNSEGLNVVSAATVSSEAMRVKTREFCLANNFEFPTLVDAGSKIVERFNVTSTPTVLLIRPDGVIDSTITSGDADLAAAIAAKRAELLGAQGS